MKTCFAGHDPVLFETNRCPVCFNIERLDKELLIVDTQVEQLKKQVVNLKETVANLESRLDPLKWNGGAS
jgi:predicted  nucleic acid-binding Zn-ribbon protein